MKEFKLKQEATNVPKENVQDVKVTLFQDNTLSDILLIQTNECWIRVNLACETFAVGSYEG